MTDDRIQNTDPHPAFGCGFSAFGQSRSDQKELFSFRKEQAGAVFSGSALFSAVCLRETGRKQNNPDRGICEQKMDSRFII